MNVSIANKKVLVTGADGFIGSHLVEGLLDKGCQVRAFLYYNSFNSWGWLDNFPKDKLSRIDVFAGDIRDPNGVRPMHAGHGYSLSSGGTDCHTFQLPLSGQLCGYQHKRYVECITGRERLLLRAGSDHINLRGLWYSAQYVPIDEKHPFQGQSPYSATKIGADRLAESFFPQLSIRR